MSTSADIPLLIINDNANSERRISPSWSISHLKDRLEPITGVPASCQRLSLKVGSQTPQPIEAADEDATQLAQWPLQAYAELHVGKTPFPPHRPTSLASFRAPASVIMPADQTSKLRCFTFATS